MKYYILHNIYTDPMHAYTFIAEEDKKSKLSNIALNQVTNYYTVHILVRF